MTLQKPLSLLAIALLAGTALAGCGGGGTPAPTASSASNAPTEDSSKDPFKAPVPESITVPESAVPFTEVVTDAGEISKLSSAQSSPVPMDGAAVSETLNKWGKVALDIVAEQSRKPGAHAMNLTFVSTSKTSSEGRATKTTLSFGKNREGKSIAEPGKYILETICQAPAPVNFTIVPLAKETLKPAGFALKGSCGVNEAVRMHHSYDTTAPGTAFDAMKVQADQAVPGILVVTVRPA
ncbi:MAG: hypothetical protein Q3997_06580 [Propionibacteriaceae bacterium]|nr:hypothetical protein [Propionibacteriaceae bacterium]